VTEEATMTGPAHSSQNITINSEEGFRSSLEALRTLQSEIAKKKGEGKALTEALTAAASRNAVPPGGTSGTGTVAPILADTVTAATAAVKNAAEAADAAHKSVTAAIADLTSLLNGLTSIQRSGAHAVTEV
jgi:hypothetical protein